MDIISNVIVPIAAILKKKIYHFVTLQSMTMPSFMSKAFSYQDIRMGSTKNQTKIPQDR